MQLWRGCGGPPSRLLFTSAEEERRPFSRRTAGADATPDSSGRRCAGSGTPPPEPHRALLPTDGQTTKRCSGSPVCPIGQGRSSPLILRPLGEHSRQMARAFILGHGASIPGRDKTFVPAGKSISFYSEVNTNTLHREWTGRTQCRGHSTGPDVQGTIPGRQLRTERLRRRGHRPTSGVGILTHGGQDILYRTGNQLRNDASSQPPTPMHHAKRMRRYKT